MSEWRKVELSEVSLDVADGDWVETKDQGGSDFRLLQVSNIGVGQFRETGRYRYVTKETFARLRCTEVLPGMVLVARMPDPVGRSWFVDRLEHRAITAVDVAIIKPDPSVLDGRFCSYALNTPDQLALWAAEAGGTTRMRITRRQLAAARLALPSLPKQRQIAAALALFDDLIENNRRRIELLEQMAQEIYREWFVHFRYPGHEDAALVDSFLGLIPEGWQVKPFAELASFVNGFAFKPAHWGESGMPIIKIKQLKHGVTADTPRCNGKEISKRFWVQTGDVLFSWSADLGVYRWSDEPGLLNQHLFNVTSSGELSLPFLLYALDEAMPHFWDRAQGTTMRHIRRAALSEVTTAVPTQALVHVFTAAVDPLDQVVLKLRQSNRRLAATRDLLLPKLVTGEIDVSNLDLDAVVGSAL